ncbi:MAG: hypothetical protein H0T50_16515, partial [Gemmatimonadales bacterium]|nr:hypothetical protein [Gemmatimonadales bacterium]
MTDHRTLLILTLLLAIVPPARAFAQEGPQVYQPGTFSTGAWDFFVALTPDQRT